MVVFAEHGQTLGQAIAYVEHLFSQKGTIRLMTGHKAKGLEFETVYHLDSWLCRDDEQDQNLRYVITTRSADRLYHIDSERIKW
jgi:ATP-dependent exoDNAse (exonuclease V) beta subunit